MWMLGERSIRLPDDTLQSRRRRQEERQVGEDECYGMHGLPRLLASSHGQLCRAGIPFQAERLDGHQGTQEQGNWQAVQFLRIRS